MQTIDAFCFPEQKECAKIVGACRYLSGFAEVSSQETQSCC